MNKIVCYIAVLFLLMLWFGTPALAAESQNVSSLFYLQGKMPPILPFVLVYMLVFSLVALFLANAFFSWLKVKHSIELLEAFVVEKLYQPDEVSPISLVAYREFKSGLLEDELIIGSKCISHRGVYLLKCNPPDRIDLASLHLMENISRKWKRPLLYLGRNEQGIMEVLMKDFDLQDKEMTYFERHLSPYLFLLPSLHPDPENVFKAAKKLKRNSNLGAVIIEHMNYPDDIKKYLVASEMNKFAEISQNLRIPVFILYPGGDSHNISENSFIGENSDDLFSAGEIKLEKGNEIFAI